MLEGSRSLPLQGASRSAESLPDPQLDRDRVMIARPTAVPGPAVLRPPEAVRPAAKAEFLDDRRRLVDVLPALTVEQARRQAHLIEDVRLVAVVVRPLVILVQCHHRVEQQ